MAGKPVLDLDALLAPVPGNNPAGESLRYAGDYDEIKGLLPKPDRDAFEGGGEEGQWAKLIQSTSQKLRAKSKDLQIACWLVEGLVHDRQGATAFVGLRDGFQLLQGLCEQFWDGLHPPIDDGDLDARAAPLRTLLEVRENPRSATRWIGEIPLTKEPVTVPDTNDKVFVSYNLWNSIVVDKHEDKLALLEAMESATAKTPTEFLQQRYGEVVEAEAALTSLRTLLDERFGRTAPGVVGVAEMLRKCKNRLASVLKDRGFDPEASAESDENSDEAGEESAAGAESRGGGASAGPIRSREDALAKLREVADFFRRTEPHSPVPFLIQRAINWTRMSFDQLMLELVKDENARSAINSTLGIAVGEASYGGNGQEDNE